jgi:hypothetical protein
MLPDTQSGAQVRVAGAAAMELIEAQAEQSGNPYVFPSNWTGTWYKQVPDLVERLCKAAQFASGGIDADQLRTAVTRLSAR